MTDEPVEERRCPVCSGLLEDNERVHRRCAPALVTLFDNEADEMNDPTRAPRETLYHRRDSRR